MQPVSTGPDQETKCLTKMLKNSHQAVSEHFIDGFIRQINAPFYMAPYGVPTLEEVLKPSITPFTFTWDISETRGRDSRMNDRHFCTDLGEGLFVGVFDGYNGHDVSEYARDRMQKDFKAFLDINNGNPHAAFELIFNQIMKEIRDKPSFSFQGAVCTLSYIVHNRIYTATIGDCKTTLHRRSDKRLGVIALSVWRNWSDEREALRAATFLKDDSIVKDWATKNPREIYFPPKGYGTNWSRAFGMAAITAPRESPLIAKPKITVNLIRKGDVILLSSNGLREKLQEAEIEKILLSDTPDAKALTSRAEELGSKNVTVIKITVA